MTTVEELRHYLRVFLELFVLLVFSLLSLSPLFLFLVVAFANRYELLAESTQHLNI